MDVTPVDQGAILRSGQAAVPDYAAEMIRRQLAGAQVQQANTEAQRVAAAMNAQQRTQQRQDAYMQEVTAYQAHPTSQGLVNIMARYPEFSEGANRAYQAQDTQAKDADFQATAEIHEAARGGHYALAASQLRTRDAADQAAGHPPDPHHAAILADLESGDPARQRAATEALSGLTAIMAGPERYAAVYGANHPAPHEMNGILYDNDGNPIAQDPRGRVIPGQNGAFYQEQPIANVPMLGGSAAAPSSPAAPVPATGAPTPSASNLPRAGQSMPSGMFQGWQVIGVPGDARRRGNGRVDSHNGVDFRPPAGNPHLTADRPLEVIGGQSGPGAADTPRGRAGITAIVSFPDGAEFNLMHLAAPVQPGHYEPGQVFATAGGTGNAHGSTQIHVQPWGGTQHDPRAYFGRGVGTHSSPVAVRTVQEARALPVGTPYTTPDGQRFVR